MERWACLGPTGQMLRCVAAVIPVCGGSTCLLDLAVDESSKYSDTFLLTLSRWFFVRAYALGLSRSCVACPLITMHCHASMVLRVPAVAAGTNVYS